MWTMKPISLPGPPLATKDSSAFPGLPGSEIYRSTTGGGYVCRPCRERLVAQAQQAMKRGSEIGACLGARPADGTFRTRDVLTGEVNVRTFTEQPDEESAELARFALSLFAKHQAAHLTRRVRVVPEDVEEHRPWKPEMKWFQPDGRSSGFAVRDRYLVALATDLRGPDLTEIVAHEVRHVAQKALPLADSDYAAEVDAEAYGHKWGPAAFLAFRESRGDPERIHFTDRLLPPLRGRNGDLVITKDGRLWRYAAFAATAWTHVRD